MKSKAKSVFYDENVLRYQIVPPIFLLFFTSIVQVLSLIGRNEVIHGKTIWYNLWGNEQSWTWLFAILFWAYLSLIVPSKTVLGPETPYGVRPTYKDNGFLYYCVTVTVFFVAQSVFPGLSGSLYDNFPQLLGCFSLTALILCSYLWFKGKYFPEHKNDVQEPQPILYEFYRGLELHPKVFGVDVKQLTNCRIGLMGWQIFILSFFFTGWQRNGFRNGSAVDVLLQTVYIGKFFWWESGYFYTLDMMLDRAGYYLCWGCLVWVTGFYTYSSYFQVAHPPSLTPVSSLIILFTGLIAIFLNYRVDYEKQLFRNSKDFKCTMWGKPAQYIIAEYKDNRGVSRKSALLTSGFWGIGRHINYTFELLAAWSWCAPGALGLSPISFLPFSYFLFLFGLLLHRTIRDEDKCSKKYGKYWDLYCKKVPYRLIPYVW